jgi:natural product biosynthesis luciferase-like monooxygenase protein
VSRREIAFGLMFFSAARFGDERGFRFISTPERHFHGFGGAFPQPAVLSAAIAAVTRQIQIRAGSVVAPLHHMIRIVEEWSVVDNLSGGRAAVSFAAGWNVDDFVLAPAAYERRREVLHERIAGVRQAWRSGRCRMDNPMGRAVTLRLYPRPVQRELPAWLTVSRNPDGFTAAGRAGLNVLTHLESQDVGILEHRIAEYRSARAEGGYDPATGVVTLMQHTLLADDTERARALAYPALRRYLGFAADLERQSVADGGSMSGGRDARRDQTLLASDSARDEMVDLAVLRLFAGASLIGSIADCREHALGLAAIGVDEIACLIDFVDDDAVMRTSLDHLDELQRSCSRARLEREERAAIARLMGGT